MRHLILLFWLAFIAASPGKTNRAGHAVLILKHSPRTGLQYGYLQVGDKYLGRIYSGKSLRIQVICGKPITVFFYRKRRVHRLVVNPSPGDARTILLDFSGKKRGYLKLILPRRSVLRRLRVTINGKQRGTIHRGQTLHFSLSAGTAAIVLTSPGTVIKKQILIQAGKTNDYQPLSPR